MARHTTFRFCLDPTVEQAVALERHVGASRFAYNQCLRFVLDARTARAGDRVIKVPRTGYDLIKRFNAWKKSDAAGRVFAVDAAGVVIVRETGLVWRHEVFQQVFEEAAVDLGRGLAAWSQSRRGERAGPAVAHPRFKKKATARASFRLRNQFPKGGKAAIRLGDGHPRSVRLPGIGVIRVWEDTRRLRRMIAKSRARVLFATVSRRRGRWWVSLNVEAVDLHPERRHVVREESTPWVGVDLGLTTLAVAARSDGTVVDRIDEWPRTLAVTSRRRRRLHRAVTRKKKGSKNRREAADRLGRFYFRTAEIRRRYAHEVSNRLVKTHDRLVIENLNVNGMLARNPNLAEAIHDVGWGRSGVSSPTSRRGAEVSSRSPTAGSRPPRPARAAAPCRTWAEWRCGRTSAGPAGSSSTATATPRPISPPGPSCTTVQAPGPGTFKQRARSPTPTDGNALAAASAAVKRTRTTWELTPGCWTPERRTPEKGGARGPSVHAEKR